MKNVVFASVIFFSALATSTVFAGTPSGCANLLAQRYGHGPGIYRPLDTTPARRILDDRSRPRDADDPKFEFPALPYAQTLRGQTTEFRTVGGVCEKVVTQIESDIVVNDWSKELKGDATGCSLVSEQISAPIELTCN